MAGAFQGGSGLLAGVGCGVGMSLRRLDSETARVLAALPRHHDRPRCCRWARSGPHRWERELVHCGNGWREISLLYWRERRPQNWKTKRASDYAFCPCGHTVACHLTPQQVLELEGRSAEDEAAREARGRFRVLTGKATAEPRA